MSTVKEPMDLIGVRFGKLTVIADEGRQKGKRYLRCKCDCGSVVLSRMDSLRSGKKTSCGCDSVHNLTGNRYGKLTVIARGSKKKMWLCKCDCGRLKEVQCSNLTGGKTKSCGCSNTVFAEDMVGRKFGRLTVLRKDGETKERKHRVKWLCRCDCGVTTSVYTSNLLKGITKSCGCLFKERVTSHGLSKSKIYRTWASMISRCKYDNFPSYPWYGGRGIKVCDRWKKFENFYDDIGKFKKPGTQLDRIDTNGNYEPSNCRWVTPHENNLNKRNNVFVTINGIKKRWVEWRKDIRNLTKYEKKHRNDGTVIIEGGKYDNTKIMKEGTGLAGNEKMG